MITKQSKRDYAPLIKLFLEEQFDIKLDRIAQNTLRVSTSDTVIHTKISSDKNRWFGLDTNIFNYFMGLSDNVFLALSLDGPERTFILPKEEIQQIFDLDAARPRPRRTQTRWMIRISSNDADEYFLRIDHSDKSFSLNEYLNRWRQIPEIEGIYIDQSKITEKIIESAIKYKNVELIKEVLTGERCNPVIQRLGQNALRKQALIQYSVGCALCDIKDKDMLIASHIVPWSRNVVLRGVLGNVICLCRFHDRLFEKGKIVILNDFSIKFSQSFIKMAEKSQVYSVLKKITNKQLRLPLSEHPSIDLLSIHRQSFSNEVYD